MEFKFTKKAQAVLKANELTVRERTGTCSGGYEINTTEGKYIGIIDYIPYKYYITACKFNGFGRHFTTQVAALNALVKARKKYKAEAEAEESKEN